MPCVASSTGCRIDSRAKLIAEEGADAWIKPKELRFAKTRTPTVEKDSSACAQITLDLRRLWRSYDSSCSNAARRDSQRAEKNLK
jgi:hypothetical protein